MSFAIPTQYMALKIEASFTAPDPWNQARQTVFNVECYGRVAKFLLVDPNLRTKLEKAKESYWRGGFDRAIRSRTDNVRRFLPASLTELFRKKQVPPEALAWLLHEIEPMLKKGDYGNIRQSKFIAGFVWFELILCSDLLIGTAESGTIIDENIPNASLVAAGLAALLWFSAYVFCFRWKLRKRHQLRWLLERQKQFVPAQRQTTPAGRGAGGQPASGPTADRVVSPPSAGRAGVAGSAGRKAASVPRGPVTPRKPRVNLVYELDDGGRKPSVKLTYDAEREGAMIQRELPFVVGVLGDFAGDPMPPLASRYPDRRFIRIDRDNYDDIMALIGPGLNLQVEDTLAGDGSEMAVRLDFKSIQDFGPGRVVEQVPSLKALLETRNRLRDMSPQDQQQIAGIDRRLSAQLNAIIHSKKFLALEGSWRGLYYLVDNSETGKQIKIRILNASKRELYRDLIKAAEVEQSRVFKQVYAEEFGTPAGEPFGILIGDYQWTSHPQDIETLRQISSLAAACFCPFISAPAADLVGVEDWPQLCMPRDLAKIAETIQFVPWRSFRESADARFVALVLPRVLARLPYGPTTGPGDSFTYEERPVGAEGVALPLAEHAYCWMNAAYILGARMTDSFFRTGSCVAIRGPESGGKVENLLTRIFNSEDGGTDLNCPTEIPIDERREIELSNLGFLPLLHYKNANFAVFFSSQTVAKPVYYDRPEATANAAISARLPYMMVTSRFAHYLMIIARDKVGGLKDPAQCEAFLNRWISTYVNATDRFGPERKTEYPLREAHIEVREDPHCPGSYHAIARLHPWLNMEELSIAMRIVVRIPEGW